KLILHSHQELETQKQDIISSINYAKRIQTAILPHEETISRSLPLYFIFYKPKDIVSGYFYWFHEIDNDNCIMACADCTGHGVPGAFMTVIASNLLNQTVIDNKIYDPATILYEVDKLLNMTLKQDKERLGVQDGMDITLIRIDKHKNELIVTSAKRPVFFVSDNKLQEFKGSKTSIGGMREGEKKFEEFILRYKEDDMLYMFTDGFHDQFGGEKGKKYSTKRLKEKLFAIHKDSISEQKEKLEKEILKWKGDLEQVDDICIAGIRF
ncbi:MAG: serine/threonine protein kinase, partial [Bacteroidota bacterium]|nr:serine/threonine protein kinase [Bacteroidota bacterium]